MRRIGAWTAACLCIILLLAWISGGRAQDPIPESGLTGASPPAGSDPSTEVPADPAAGDPDAGEVPGDPDSDPSTPVDPDAGPVPAQPDSGESATGAGDPLDPVTPDPPSGEEQGPDDQAPTGPSGDDDDDGGQTPQPPSVCSAQAPPPSGVSVPLYLIDHHTVGAQWHPDFFMLRGFSDLSDDEVAGDRPSFCAGDLPRGCSAGCAEAECGLGAIDGLALHQVAPQLDPSEGIVYRNSAEGEAPALETLGALAATNPELVPASQRHSIHSAESFASWFKLSPPETDPVQTNYVVQSASFTKVARPSDRPAPSADSTDELQHYRYSCDPCFPLDGRVWGNQNDGQLFRVPALGTTVTVPLDSTQSHNYGFTGQMHTSFAWRGGLSDEYLTVYAMDDSFVFIDGQLVMDMGGIHQLACRTLNLATGALSGGVAQFFDGKYSCPDTPIPLSAQAAPFDPVSKAGRPALTLSMYFTQRSAPRFIDERMLPVSSVWRVETNVDLEGGVGLASTVPALVPANAPLPTPTPTILQPLPGFIVSNMLMQLSNAHTREPVLLHEGSVVYLHQGAATSEVLLIGVNTVPTADLTVTCADPLGLVTMDALTFGACESFPSRATTMFYAQQGSSQVVCNASTPASSNFADATSVSFQLRVLGDNQAPVAIAQMEGAVGFGSAQTDGANGEIFALLNGARSFDPDGLLIGASWELLSPPGLAPLPTIDTPDRLVTYVRGLQLGQEYQFKLSVSDDMPAGYALTGEAMVLVKVPETNPYTAAPVPSDPDPDVVELVDSGVTLHFEELSLDTQTELNLFNRAALHSVRRAVLDEMNAPLGTSLDDTLLLATRVPYQLGAGEVASTVALTFLLRSSISSTQSTVDIVNALLIDVADPGSQLRSEQPALVGGAVADVPAEIQQEPATYPPDPAPLDPNTLVGGGDGGSDYSRAGLYVGVALAVLIGVALLSFGAWWLYSYWRNRRSPMLEHEKASIMRASPRHGGSLPMALTEDSIVRYTDAGIDAAIGAPQILSPSAVQMHRIEEGADGRNMRSDDLHLAEEPL